MSGNITGRIFRVITWGESHGPMVGGVVDGCPSGINLCEEDVQNALREDCPDAQMKTPRNEKNHCRIVSGVFEGKTLGTPISILIENKDTRSVDYEPFKDIVRPGHGDFTYRQRYGHVDWRGGGRSSGREAVARIACSVIAQKINSSAGILVHTEIEELCGIKVTDGNIEQAREEIQKVKNMGDSSGGVIKIVCKNVPSGTGNPVFDKLDAVLASAMMSIGGVKAFESGEGIEMSKLCGSVANDQFETVNGSIKTSTNRCGGILGGISTGNDIIMRLFVKPVPSIFVSQKTVNYKTKNSEELMLNGRFDSNMTPRIAKVAKAMAHIVLADQLLLSGKIKIGGFM